MERYSKTFNQDREPQHQQAENSVVRLGFDQKKGMVQQPSEGTYENCSESSVFSETDLETPVSDFASDAAGFTIRSSVELFSGITDVSSVDADP